MAHSHQEEVCHSPEKGDLSCRCLVWTGKQLECPLGVSALDKGLQSDLLPPCRRSPMSKHLKCVDTLLPECLVGLQELVKNEAVSTRFVDSQAMLVARITAPEVFQSRSKLATPTLVSWYGWNRSRFEHKQSDTYVKFFPLGGPLPEIVTACRKRGKPCSMLSLRFWHVEGIDGISHKFACLQAVEISTRYHERVQYAANITLIPAWTVQSG